MRSQKEKQNSLRLGRMVRTQMRMQGREICTEHVLLREVSLTAFNWQKRFLVMAHWEGNSLLMAKLAIWWRGRDSNGTAMELPPEVHVARQ